MAKEPIFWIIRKPAYGYGGHEVVAVTSESYGQLYGRTKTGRTSLASRDVVARFPSEADALAGMARVKRAQDHHAPLVQAARIAYDTANARMREAIELAAQGEEVADGPVSLGA